MSSRKALAALERLRAAFGPAASREKRALIAALAKASFDGPRDLLRFHELLCFWRAYPDDPRLRRAVEAQLASFHHRPDLRRHAARLSNSGIAGTEIRFRFFAPMARWLARRWPQALAVDWKEWTDAERLEPWLALMAHSAELPALDEYEQPASGWIRAMKGQRSTDAAFLIEGFSRLPMSEVARDALVDSLDPPFVVRPGPGTPQRTTAALRVRRVTWQRDAFPPSRVTGTLIRRSRPRSVRFVPPREAERLIDLAREAMVTRSRDLDAFSYASPEDVRLVEYDGGLQFVTMGMLPERRLLFEGVYGHLTLKNGVPVGYVLTASLFRSAEVAYNVFDTFRGAEAAATYARVLGLARVLFGAGSFVIPPYQLGQGNDEALRSGAWWFYHKAGFRPRESAALRLMRSEEQLMARDRSHRSGPRVLERLSSAPLFFHLGATRSDVLGVVPLADVGLAVMRMLGDHFSAKRDEAEAACAEAARARLDVRLERWSEGERAAWFRWAPVVMLLPGLDRWAAHERAALAEVIRAKGGLRESEFVLQFDRHPKLGKALAKLARSGAKPRARDRNPDAR